MARATLIRNLDDVPDSLRGGALAIGNFDGIHRGHARIVRRLVDLAKRVGGAPVVFTFDPHPVRLLRPADSPPPLTWLQRKAELLGQLGVAATIAYPTDKEILSCSPEDFFDRIVRHQFAAKGMVEGPNFCFGHNRSGSIQLLETLCRRHGITLDVVEPLEEAGQWVSSSRIRHLIRSGRLREADQLLVQPYRIRGPVIRGAGRGATLGFPTANVDPMDIVLPPIGVYAGRVRFGQAQVEPRCDQENRAETSGREQPSDDSPGSRHCQSSDRAPSSADLSFGIPASVDSGVFAAAIHIGPNPTFGEDSIKYEVHVIDYRGDLVGRMLEVEFLTRLRDVRPFADIHALKKQLNQDIQAARTTVRATEKQTS